MTFAVLWAVLSEPIVDLSIRCRDYAMSTLHN